ncbi:MAG: solute carrier family 26 protein [Myxococcales bacterium]|nr:solute carrier family 26 protein [Myxococcales bacterium]MCB9643889.1 solute carrier family 26 protein [Myxococcales bacterium]
MKAITRWVPALGWLRDYKRENLRGDMVAGLTVAIMLIPQGMAYAMLAGLPPYVGLYASVLPPFLYALFGSSRQLAFGPVAMDSLLVATGVGAMALAGSKDYIVLALTLGVLVGVLQIAMGLMRLGFLVNFLSRPVISGFTSAAALIIGLSQLKHLVGMDLKRSNQIHVIVADVFQKIGTLHLLTLIIGLSSVALLVAFKKFLPKWPGALFAVLLGTLAVWLFGLHHQKVQIVGTVPAGLPGLTLPRYDWATIQKLIPIALTISLVAFLEAISVARAIATRRRYAIDANQELIAMGMANLGGGLTGGYPGTGGFSRSAVNDQAGAETGLASMITSVLIALTLMFFTPLFYFLPKAVLASIVMVAVFGLIDLKEPVRLWKVKRADALLLLLTFVVTLTVGIQQGIFVGVGVSLLLFIGRSTRPHTAVLGRLKGTDIYRNIERFPEVETWPGVVIFRLDASFYFANVAFFKETVHELLLKGEQDGKPVKAVIVDASGINFVDSSAEEALQEVARELKEAGVAFYLSGVKGPVRDVLRRSGFCAMLGEEHFTFRIQDAVDAVLEPHQGEPQAIFETGLVNQRAGTVSVGAYLASGAESAAVDEPAEEDLQAAPKKEEKDIQTVSLDS